jgi:AcrR family transcriptional regulator
MPVNSSSSPRTGARKAARKPARASLRGAVAEVFRKAILESAEKVFRTEGFADAKIAKIAQQAGLAAGTIYNYFDSKESIFRALIDHRAEEFWTGLQTIAAQTSDPRERLLQVTGATLEYMESNSPMCMLFEQLGGHSAMALRKACGPSADRLRTRYLGFYQEILADAARAGLVRKELPLDEITLVFTGGVYGLLLGWKSSGRTGRLRDRAALLVDLFLEGAGSRT